MIRQSCGKQLAPDTSASWVPSSLAGGEPVLPVRPTHWAIHADLVWGGSGVTWLQGSPAPWPGLCLGTHGGCRAGDAQWLTKTFLSAEDSHRYCPPS